MDRRSTPSTLVRVPARPAAARTPATKPESSVTLQGLSKIQGNASTGSPLARWTSFRLSSTCGLARRYHASAPARISR